MHESECSPGVNEEKTEARMVVAGHVPAENPTTDQGETPAIHFNLGSVFSSPLFGRDNDEYPCHSFRLFNGLLKVM